MNFRNWIIITFIQEISYARVTIIELQLLRLEIHFQRKIYRNVKSKDRTAMTLIKKSVMSR